MDIQIPFECGFISNANNVLAGDKNYYSEWVEVSQKLLYRVSWSKSKIIIQFEFKWVKNYYTNELKWELKCISHLSDTRNT